MEAREASVATCTELYIPSRVGIHLLKNVLLKNVLLKNVLLKKFPMDLPNANSRRTCGLTAGA